ncbi:hypothetical protein KP509_13G021300 [Ceratopteris richardii]|nr:hypothetical protein KP509_13G021300 [Ceratopteris richardii]
MERSPDLRNAFASLSMLCLLIFLFSQNSYCLLTSAEQDDGDSAEPGNEGILASFLQTAFKQSQISVETGQAPKKSGTQSSSECMDGDDGEALQELCPVTCFRPDPVCGSDGVTYWCGCKDARCAGVKVSHVGFCKIRSSASTEKGSQALLLLHTIWLALLGFSCLFGLL